MSINAKTVQTVFQSLSEKRRWVCYEAVPDEAKQKVSKVPINPHTGWRAKSNDSRTWGTLKQALYHMSVNCRVAGIMLALSTEDDLVGVDIDHCWDPVNNMWSPLAKKIMEIANSYTEISPSGQGLRIMLYGQLPSGGRKNSQNGVEMYECGRFLTITGNHVPETVEEICRRDEELKELHRDYLGMKDGLDTECIRETRLPRSTIFDDDELLELAVNSANGEKFETLNDGYWEDDYGSQSEADFAFCCMLAFWTGWSPDQMDRIFRSSELYRPKWDRRHYGDGKTYGQGVIQKAIEVTDSCYLQDGWED